jgi:hypothetical protein
MPDQDQGLPALTAEQVANGYRCKADADGNCPWMGCPQKHDGEPAKSGRKCPLLGNRSRSDQYHDEETGATDEGSEEF